MIHKCPHCRRPADDTPANADRPFCSARCRELDLLGWLDEGYRIPGPTAGDPRDAGDDDGHGGLSE